MSKIQFRNAAHRDFVLENLDKCKVNDCYHRAFFYVMGISEETRMNIGKMFDFKRDCIIPEGMHGGWQTSGTVKVCHLAFNLWNGFTEEGRENLYTPEELFCCCLLYTSHCHFVINSISFVDGKHLWGEEKAWFKFRKVADRICEK